QNAFVFIIPDGFEPVNLTGNLSPLSSHIFFPGQVDWLEPIPANRAECATTRDNLRATPSGIHTSNFIHGVAEVTPGRWLCSLVENLRHPLKRETGTGR